MASVPVPNPLLETTTNPIIHSGTDISAYRPLISAILLVSNNQPDALVNFEAVRNALGNQTAIQKLGWGTYTSFVENARRRDVLEIIETSGGFKFIRLLPTSLSVVPSKAKSPPAVSNLAIQ